jgi:NAD(P)H-hydrate epimerase
MATAGMGDILSGMIAGLMAQHLEHFAATQAAVWLHAVAAEQLAVGSGRGMVATDLLPVVKQLVK